MERGVWHKELDSLLWTWTLSTGCFPISLAASWVPGKQLVEKQLLMHNIVNQSYAACYHNQIKPFLIKFSCMNKYKM